MRDILATVFLTVSTALAVAGAPLRANAAQVVQQGYVSAVLIGAVDPSNVLPTFDKVPGTSTDNLDVALPTSVLRRGNNYVVMIMSQVATFSGNCKTSFKLTQTTTGTAVVLASGSYKAYACSTGQIFGYSFGTKPIGGVAGPAILSGTVAFGTENAFGTEK